jgi:hypothetical protein
MRAALARLLAGLDHALTSRVVSIVLNWLNAHAKQRHRIDKATHATCSTIPRHPTHPTSLRSSCVGLAVAYALTRAPGSGAGSVLLLEREPHVCSVTSSQAAGLVGQMRSGGPERIRLAMKSVAEFTVLQDAGQCMVNTVALHTRTSLRATSLSTW